MKTSFRVSVSLAAAAIMLCAGCAPGGDSAQFETVAVTRGDLRQQVTASGALGAVVSVDVGSQVSGKITELDVDFNSPVKKGQVLARIDPTSYIAALEQAEGDLAGAEAGAVLKRQNLERKKVLFPQQAASQLDLDQAVADLAQAEATLMIKRATVKSARNNLDYCRITSPVDGIVIARKVDAGQTLAASFTTPVLFTIAQDIAKMNISASVSEADIGQVRVGHTVDFTVDAYPDELFHGKVAQVRKAPTTTQNVVTYETIIAVNNPELKLFPGMTANVSILVVERKAVLMIPNTALRYSPPDGVKFEQAQPKNFGRNQRLVYSPGIDPSQLKPVLVKVGITDGVATEILDGLGDKTSVVTSTILFRPKGSGFGPKPQQGPQ